jgi:hypothetical protein
MSRLGKTLGLVFAVLVLVLAAGVTFTIGWRPFIGPRARALTARKFGSTPARLARGEYLVRDVTNCMACHAEHDWTAHDAPILPNTLGAGQDMKFLKGVYGELLLRRATWHETLLHPFLYVIDFKRALSFGEAQRGRRQSAWTFSSHPRRAAHPRSNKPVATIQLPATRTAILVHGG